MDTEGNDTGNGPEQFHNLIREAIETPDNVDTNDLLTASNAVLETLHDGHDVLVPMVRSLAEAGMYFAVFGRHHEVLRVRAHAFYETFANLYPA